MNTRTQAPATKIEKVRNLFSDRKWHSGPAIERIGGNRFGARIFDCHVGIDGFHYERRADPKNEFRFLYRQTDEAHCVICSDPSRCPPSETIKRQAQTIAVLSQRIAELEAACAQ